MTMSDPVGDMLTRLRNAQMRGRSQVVCPASNLRGHILDVLKDEGFIRGYSRVDHEDGKADFNVELKYFDGAPVIHEIKRVSKPGRRVYSPVRDMPLVNNGLGISIISTPKGVMSDTKARELNVGGEIICTVF